MPEYLTTREIAELLRIKERKVYDLASSGKIPCTKAMGKLLFPLEAVQAWLATGSVGPGSQPRAEIPAVFLGSHDPLLDWALRESKCGIATFFDGSHDGLKRFGEGEGIATGLHIYDAGHGDWNVHEVSARFADRPVVLVEWASRRRGIIHRPDTGAAEASLEAFRGRRFAPRQAEAGSQSLLLALLDEAGLGAADFEFSNAARTESDAVLMVLEGKADATFGLEALARQHGLPFVPVIDERFDILVDRRAWFEPPMQALLEFCRGALFGTRAAEFAGYDVSGFGRVHFNGP